MKIKNGTFSDYFVRINTDDGVAGQIIINRISGYTIDLNVRQFVINDESEAREVIRLIENGIDYLNGKC